MRDHASVNRINRYAVIEIRTTRFSKGRSLKRLVDVNQESIALKVLHDKVRVFYGNNDIVPIDIDLSAILAD